MTFTSLTFLFLFLPLSGLLFALLPRRMQTVRVVLLILTSLLFYAWGDAKAFLILLLSILFHYASIREMITFRRNGRASFAKIALITTIAVDVIVLGIYKYTTMTMPLGLSFYTFSALSYVLDQYMGRCDEDENFLHAALYLTFFPKVISGPIVSFADFMPQIETACFRKKHLISGMRLFLIGLFKKVLLADQLGMSFRTIYALPKVTGLTAILGVVYYSLQLYFDFSGYSDMAIGLSEILGFKIEKNFDYPYLSKSISEFWRRWHISLGAWFRNYVYIPLGGNRCSTLLQVRNLAIVWLLTGIWHGSTLNFVFWGIWHGLFVILERFVIKDKMDRIPGHIRVFFTNLVVFLGWICFFTPNLSGVFTWIGKMFCADGLGFVGGTSIFYLYTNLLLLVLSVIACGPVLSQIESKILTSKNRIVAGLGVALHVVLFVLCIAFLVSSTYQSFLYFQF